MNLQLRNSLQWQNIKALFAIFILVLGLMPPTPAFAEDTPGKDAFEFHGAISKLPTTSNLVGDWTVGGKVIHVSSTTLLNQEAGKAAVGAYVEIKGTPNSDGSLNAAKIEVQLSGAAVCRRSHAEQEDPIHIDHQPHGYCGCDRRHRVQHRIFE